MNVINDLSVMLALRGITQVKAAQACGMKAVSFCNRYAHADKPGHDVRWKRVLQIMHDEFEIAYENKRGWFLMSEADKAEELRLGQMMIDRMCKRRAIHE